MPVSRPTSVLKTAPIHCFFVWVLVFAIFTQPSRGRPWLEEHQNHVVFRSHICQPLAQTELQRLMGSAYDDARMAPTLEIAKQRFGSDPTDDIPPADSNSLHANYPRDQLSHKRSAEHLRVPVDFKTLYTERRRRSVPHLKSKPENTDDVNTALPQDENSQISRGNQSSIDNTRPPAAWLLNRLQNPTERDGNPPPWECKMTSSIRVMKEGVFPQVVVEGQCITSKCFYDLYDCQPIKYAIKLLQRDPQKCNPVANLESRTTYEEHWNLVTHYITVGCNCVNAQRPRRILQKTRVKWAG